MIIVATLSVLSLVGVTAVAVLIQTVATKPDATWALLPVVVIHLFAARVPAAMPSWLAFLAGLSMDLATQGPPGYWALIYLAGLFWLRITGGWQHRAIAIRAGRALGTVLIVAATQYVVASLYLMQPARPAPIVESAAIIAILVVAFELVMPTSRILPHAADATIANARRRG
jgi:hypothetical protein